LTDRFVWRHWPDGSVVFDREKGSTQAVSTLVRAVLEALREEPSLSEDMLVKRLAATHPQPGLGAAVAEARELLSGSGLL
jgi:PqqD family protein of HPr-rel-A system